MSSQELSEGRRAAAAPALPGSPYDTTAMISLRERERVRLGFDLHDGPAQTMSAALLQLRMLEDAGPDEIGPGLAEARDTIAHAVAEIYAIIDGLDGNRSPEIDFVTHVGALVADACRLSDIDTTLHVEGDPSGLSAPEQIVLFRIIQEALSNVRRHSGATHAGVWLRFDATRVSCEVADDGAGFDPTVRGTARFGREPYGLASMHERARMLGGECVVESARGRGTRVLVRIPR